MPATSAPRLALIGPDTISSECHTTLVDPGVRISDAPVSIAAGVAHSLALKADGSVVAWGSNNFGQTNVPASLGPAIAIAANSSFSLSLKADGSVVAWGDGSYGQTNIPPAATHDVVAIAAGGFHALALRTEGSVVGWGDDATGEIDIPPGATNIIAIAAGGQHSLALSRNGSVISWGSDLYGQNEVPPSVTNIVAISDSGIHCLALRADGSVVTWGYDDQFHLLRVPARATNVVAVVAKDSFSAAVRTDGSVIVWGVDPKGDVTVIPASATNVVEIAAGGELHNDFCLVRRADGSVVGWGENLWGEITPPTDLTNLDLPYAVTGDLNSNAGGTYTVTYTATNILGEVGMVSRIVVVIDTTPPELICPTNIVVGLTETDGATVTFNPQGTDLCSGPTAVICSPSSGSKFAVGTNIVVCTATDDSGNSDQCTFTVTVLGLHSVKTNILGEMVATAASQHIPLLDKAIKNLAKSMTADWWSDGLNLNSKFGGRVFTAESETVRLLRALQRQRNSELSAAQLQGWIDRLVDVDRLLTELEIQTAENAGASPKQLAGALESLAKGDRACGNDRSPLGILHYEQAWAKATRLTKRFAETTGKQAKLN